MKGKHRQRRSLLKERDGSILETDSCTDECARVREKYYAEIQVSFQTGPVQFELTWK